MNKALTITTLDKYPHLYNDVISLIENSFNYKDDHRFDIDFYPLMKKENWENLYLLLEKERVVGHVGVSLRELGNKKFKTSVVLIGGIAIDERCRGKGLLKKLLNHVISIYENNCSMFLLWSDLDELYKKFYFFQAGGQIQTGEEKLIPNEYKRVDWDQITKEQFQQIKALYNDSEYTTFLRNDKEWEDLKQITSMNLYIYDNQKEVLSYFFINKGNDLPNIIHELGYKKEIKQEVLALLSNNKLWLPEKENKHFQKEQLMYVALFKVAGPEQFRKFISDWSCEQLRINSINNEDIEFGFMGETYNYSVEKFLKYIFGPVPLEEFQDFGPSLYFSGADSI